MTAECAKIPLKWRKMDGVRLKYYESVSKMDFFFSVKKSAPKSGAVIGYSVDGEGAGRTENPRRNDHVVLQL